MTLKSLDSLRRVCQGPGTGREDFTRMQVEDTPIPPPTPACERLRPHLCPYLLAAVSPSCAVPVRPPVTLDQCGIRSSAPHGSSPAISIPTAVRLPLLHLFLAV